VYLTAVFEECTTPISGVQAKLFAPALLALFGYMFGYPAYIAVYLWRNRELVMEDQLLRVKGTGSDPLTNPNAFLLRRTMGRSYYQFKPDMFLWVLAILARKVAIAATSVIFNKNPAFQMASCLLIMFLAFSAQVQVRPYLSPGEFEDVSSAWRKRGLAEPSSVYGRLNTKLVHVAAMGRKVTKTNNLSLLTASGRVDTGAAMKLLKEWLLNYNTVESFMLFSAVLVCLLCLLYISTLGGATSNAYADSRVPITNVIIATVVLSLIYYITIVTSEVSILMAEAKKAKGRALTSKRGAKALSPEDRLRSRIREEDLSKGGVDTQLNPMLIRDGALNLGTKTGDLPSLTPELESLATGLVEHTETLPREMWQVFQATYTELLKTSSEMSKKLAELKSDVQSIQLSMGSKKKGTGASGTEGGGDGESGGTGEAGDGATLPSASVDAGAPPTTE